MGQQLGASTVVYAGGYNIGPYLASAEIQRLVAKLDGTTFGAGAKVNTPGLPDGSVKAGGYYDGSVGAVDAALAAALGPAAPAIVGMAGDAIGGRAHLLPVLQATYGIKSSVGALVAVDVEWALKQSSIGAGVWLANLAARGVTGQTTGVDGGAATTTGWRAIIECTAASGVGPTLNAKVQDSADNSTWADVTGGAFAQITTANTALYLASAAGATLRRYTRVLYTIAGTGPSFSFAAAVARSI